MDSCTCNLNIYRDTPKGNITIVEAKRVCLERLVLYKIFMEAEQFSKPGTLKWINFVKSEILKKKLFTYSQLSGEEKSPHLASARQKDHIAHWILSLCYCNTEETIDYFIKWELNWFICLYYCSNKSDLHMFLEENLLLPEEVSVIEKIMIDKDLIDCSNISAQRFHDLTFYKTHFSNISVILFKRRLFIDKGCAYFPETDLIHYLTSKLESQFKEQLKWNKLMLPNITVENRIHDFISEIPIFIPTTVNWSLVEVNLENIDIIAKEHYPLCMQNIHNVLRSVHHLKYDCKMQYGIFLKWLGLQYEDALKFWQDEFTKVMTSDWFRRKYAYLFKHQYGMVGSKIQYRPYTCMKIIQSNPGPMEHHGCPFKHWSKDKLYQKLKDDKLQSKNIRDIEDLVDEGSYQIACTKYFCAKNRICRDNVIQSPNQYAADSFQLDRNINQLLSVLFDNL